jgi:hypothetical protein
MIALLQSLPYDLKDMYAKNDAGVLRNPFGNNLLAEFAMKAIEGRIR